MNLNKNEDDHYLISMKVEKMFKLIIVTGVDWVIVD